MLPRSMNIALRRFARRNNYEFDLLPKVFFFAENRQLSPLSEAAKEIQRFNSCVDPFYSTTNVPELRFPPHWKDSLLSQRSEQLAVYARGDVDEIALFHENMFFNCLVFNSWNHYYYGDVDIKGVDIHKNHRNELLEFFNFSNLLQQTDIGNRISHWGIRHVDQGRQIFTPTDVWHARQAHGVLGQVDFLRKRTSNKRIGVLEIGCSWGGMAKKLMQVDPEVDLFLVDIPLNITTAYYYLKKCHPDRAVLLAANQEDLEAILKAPKSLTGRVVLLPSSLYPKLTQEIKPEIVCNFASFSEMEPRVCQWFFSQFPSSVQVIHETNSVIHVKIPDDEQSSGNHREISSTEFPIPAGFVLTARYQDACHFHRGRFATSNYVRF